MTRIRLVATLMAALLLLSACKTLDSLGSKEGLGGIIGGVGGGLLGSTIGGGSGKTFAIIGGTLLGVFIGSEVGASLDKADRMYAGQAARNVTMKLRKIMSIASVFFLTEHSVLFYLLIPT